MPDLVATAASVESLTMFVAAVMACALSVSLSAPGPFTVFAPHDAAIAQLPTGAIQELYNDLPALAAILRYHIASGVAIAADLIGLSVATTLYEQFATSANSHVFESRGKRACGAVAGAGRTTS